MEINKKLDLFYKAAMEEADARQQEILREGQTAYEEEVAAYEKDRQEEKEKRVRIGQEKIRREINRTKSARMLELKKERQSREDAALARLFDSVEEKLLAYRKTKAYEEQLIRMIKRAGEIAGEEEGIVYISPSDAGYAEALTQATGYRIETDKEEFLGGICMVVPGKNIRIDLSFAAELEKEREGWNGWK
jgi:vacuolar-type H+-ATPase subunit E/Vma4